MGFYTFSQNNSGGSFDYDESRGITHYVIVEADTMAEVLYCAERIGLYFDGSGDCPCCGNRWSEPWKDDKLDPEPLIYGETVTKYLAETKMMLWMAPRPEVFIHYKDGRIVGHREGDA